MKTEWSSKWPQEEGHYWFYGVCYSSDKEQAFHFVEVSKCSNGVMYVADGNFLYKGEGAKGVWTKIIFPEIPVLPLSDN